MKIIMVTFIIALFLYLSIYKIVHEIAKSKRIRLLSKSTAEEINAMASLEAALRDNSEINVNIG